MNDQPTAHTDSEDEHLLVGAYAVDAVDDIERARFERHLQTCESCAEELPELREALARIGSAEASEPPAGMRAAVMAQVSNTRQVLPPASSVGSATDSASTDAAPGNRSPRRRRLNILAAAAVVLGVVAGGAGIYSYQQNQDVDAVTAQAQEVNAVVTAPDARLKSLTFEDGAKAAVITSAQKGDAVLLARDVPALPANQVYQSWTLDAAGNATPAGTWSPGSDGSAAVPLQGYERSTAAIAVTVEPSGGSAQPTTKPIGAIEI
ncbi:MAG: anti-sigma factor [Candidatus Nanopelagicales bacterium]